MSAALDRHRARVAEIMGSTMKVESSSLPSKGTVTVEENKPYYGPSVNPSSGEYSPPYVPPAPKASAPVYEGPSVNRSTGEYVPPASTASDGRGPYAADPWKRTTPVVSPSSTNYTSPLEIRPWYPFPQQAAKSDVFTTKNVAIGAGIFVGLGLVAFLARRR